MIKKVKTFLFFFFLAFFSPYNFAIEKADIIYTGGWFGLPYNLINDLPLGHVGLFVGFKKADGKIKVIIIDCVPNYFKPGGIRKVSWKNFTHNFSYPYYGNRTTSKKPVIEQREKMVSLAYKMLNPKAYDVTHYSQKGPLLFDCVGFVEYLYEKVGLNPTPDEQETGWGWPLTPSEQFYATVPGNTLRNYVEINFKRIGMMDEIEALKAIDRKYFNDSIEIPLPHSFSDNQK